MKKTILTLGIVALVIVSSITFYVVLDSLDFLTKQLNQ